MSAPRRLDLIPNVGLEIEIVPKFEGIDHTDSSSSWKYRITNLDKIIAERHIKNIEEEEINEGVLSPTSLVTLTRRARSLAGIPDEVTSYAFFYPPQRIAEIFRSTPSYDNVKDDVFVDNFSSTFMKRPQSPDGPEEAIKSLLLLGGFAYFDENFKCVCINALSRKESEKKLGFSGPYNVHAPVYDELHRLKRTQHLMHSSFRELGYESFAWVRPDEPILLEPISKDFKYTSGALLFFREDRTTVAYAVDSSGHVDPEGEIGIISEAMANLGEIDFTQEVHRPLIEIKTWKDKISNDSSNIDTSDRNFLHKACHAALGVEFIADSLSNSEEVLDLLHQDSFGWTPLMYACRFCPSDCALIKWLVKKCPNAVMQSDNFGRCPLHVACDSSSSEEVIKILLHADKSDPKKTLLMKTTRFGFLPIHVACYGASHSIIEMLLDADPDGFSVRMKSKCNQLPLHVAILKRLPASIIKKLLDAASKVDGLKCGGVFEDIDANLPLHLACWNNSSSKTIEVLLEQDKSNGTVIQKMKPDKSNQHFSICDKPFNFDSSKHSFDVEDTIPLHLALKHGSRDIISLLLWKDKGRSTLHKTDSRGRTPLHIACEYTGDSQLIKLLVRLDKTSQTLQVDDKQGYRPLHYACEKKNTNTEIIEILCAAEETLIKRNKDVNKVKTRSAHVGDKERNYTPLHLAIKNGAPDEVIKLLMQPENFTLKGLDDHVLGDLADIVKRSEDIQDEVTDILATRFIFFVIFVELYANINAMIALSLGSRQLLHGQINWICPSLLVFSSSAFLLREIVQIVSVRGDYIGDYWSLNELVSIMFLLLTAIHMFDKIGETEPEVKTTLLCITGFLLILQTLFYLRSTFLPMARFVGGLIQIFQDLIPFIIVSLLLISAFIYASFVTKEYINCESYSDCFILMFSNVFSFEPNRTDGNISLDIIFGVIIIIVLLNVLIAIVSESWTTAVLGSTKFFWKCRLEKIGELRCLNRIRRSIADSPRSDNCILRYIDNMENIKFKDDIHWNKVPFDVVTLKDHYDKPKDYFDDNLIRKISEAKSLQADLYWSNIDSKLEHERGLTTVEKGKLIFRWCGRCIIYALTLGIGTMTCGFFFPKNFRSGFVSVGIVDEETALSKSKDAPLDKKVILSEVEKKQNRAITKIEEMKLRVELAEQVLLKRKSLLNYGVPSDEIDCAIPVMEGTCIDRKRILSRAEEKQNRAIMKIKRTKLRVELAGQVLLKRKSLLNDGVCINEIDRAIPVMSCQGGDLDYDSDISGHSSDPDGLSFAETEEFT